MTSSHFKIYLTLLFCIASFTQYASGSTQHSQPSDSVSDTTTDRLTPFERRQLKYRQRWDNLIPKYTKAQFAGGMGLISVGPGWEYGKNRQWETDLLFGIIPKHSSKKARVTMTLKQNFTLWNLPLKGNFSVDPLSTGIYVNTVFGGEFWNRNPDKYPKGYYWFSTRMRIHAFVGQRLRFTIPSERRRYSTYITAFYELSTCDLYIIQAVRNSYLKPKDYLRLSFGLKFNFF